MTEATAGVFDWRVETRRSGGGLGDKQFIIITADDTVIGAFNREERANEVVTQHNAHDSLMAALRAVEWGIVNYYDAPPEATNEISYRMCPSCLAADRPDFLGPEGHVDDCQLDAALAKGGATG